MAGEFMVSSTLILVSFSLGINQALGSKLVDIGLKNDRTYKLTLIWKKDEKTGWLKWLVLLTPKSWFLSSRLSDWYDSLFRVLRYFITSLKSRSLLIKAFKFRIRSKIIWTPALARFDTVLTLTRPTGLPPHAPVAQKIVDQRWLIANSAKK